MICSKHSPTLKCMLFWFMNPGWNSTYWLRLTPSLVSTSFATIELIGEEVVLHLSSLPNLLQNIKSLPSLLLCISRIPFPWGWHKQSKTILDVVYCPLYVDYISSLEPILESLGYTHHIIMISSFPVPLVPVNTSRLWNHPVCMYYHCQQHITTLT